MRRSGRKDTDYLIQVSFLIKLAIVQASGGALMKLHLKIGYELYFELFICPPPKGDKEKALTLIQVSPTIKLANFQASGPACMELSPNIGCEH
jgi:hypothetical protein